MSSSAQLVAVGCVNAIEQMREGGEEERLRALLREARDVLTPIVPFTRKDGTISNFTQVHADDVTRLVQRIDAALEKR